MMSVAVETLSRANVRARDIAALGITNRRETTIVWQRKTGKPAHNAKGAMLLNMRWKAASSLPVRLSNGSGMDRASSGLRRKPRRWR